MQSVVIREEKESDYQQVFELNKRAFGRNTESELVDALRKGESFMPELSIVAERNGEIVGYILFSKIKIVGEDGISTSLALAPMAVRPDVQRMGIGTGLVRYGLEKAFGLGFGSVIVLGHGNYYPKFGFKPAGIWNISTAHDAPNKTFALELREGSLTGISGIVEYPKEFSSVS